MNPPRFPALLTELESAAVRQAERRRRRRPFGLRGSALLAGMLVVSTSSAGAVLVARGVVGGEPTARYGSDAPEANSGMPLHYGSRPVLLGGAQLPAGRRFELVGYQLRSKFGSNLCLDIRFEPDGTGEGCANDSEQAQGTTLGGSLHNDGHVTGATEADIARVEVRYRSRSGRSRSSAALAHIGAGPARLAGIDAAFGFYVAPVPYDAHDITAVAYAADGRRRWTAVFPSHTPTTSKPGRAVRRKEAARPG